MSKPKKFVLNDQTVANSYGFFILTSGIKLERFNKNPVMLSDHWNTTEYVIGKWDELETTETELIAAPVFDTEDEKGKSVAGKVERGFLNGASMGIIFNPDHLVYIEGKIMLTECELYEVSIVPVPSNRNAVRLYNTDGVLLKEDEVKSLCLSVQPAAPVQENLTLTPNMKKIVLSVAALAALGFDNQPADGHEVADVEAKILGLQSSLKAEQDKNKLLSEAANAAKLAANTKMVDDAIAAGKIPADKRESFLALANSSAETVKATLDAIPAKKTLGAVSEPDASGVGEVKNLDEFCALSMDKQIAWKNANPEKYAALQ